MTDACRQMKPFGRQATVGKTDTRRCLSTILLVPPGGIRTSMRLLALRKATLFGQVCALSFLCIPRAATIHRSALHHDETRKQITIFSGRRRWTNSCGVCSDAGINRYGLRSCRITVGNNDRRAVHSRCERTLPDPVTGRLGLADGFSVQSIASQYRVG